jgi:hypothetical protein
MTARKFWTTRNGERVEICDMSDQHLLNTIRFLGRRLAAADLPPPVFNGEMAQYYADIDYDRLQAATTELQPAYHALLDEAARRNLTSYGSKIVPNFDKLIRDVQSLRTAVEAAQLLYERGCCDRTVTHLENVQIIAHAIDRHAESLRCLLEGNDHTTKD